MDATGPVEHLIAALAAATGAGTEVVLRLLLAGTALGAAGLAGLLLARHWRPRVAAARQREQDLETLWQAMDSHAMIAIADGGGRITHVNDTFLRETGFPRADLVGRAGPPVLPAEGGDPEAMRTALAEGRIWRGETRLRRRDGSTLWAQTTMVALRDAQGRVERTISLGTDITEGTLRLAEAQGRALLDRLRDEVYVVDAADLRLVYLNRSAREALGWGAEGYAGRHLADTVAEFDAAEFQARVAPLVSGEAGALTYESLHRGRPVEISLQPDRGHDGRLRFVGVVRDITGRKQAEAARGQFVATVSHELRAPLTSVMGGLKLVTSGALGPLEDKPAALLQVALRNVDRVVLLINDLLDLEKLDAGKMDMPMEPIDLGELVQEAAAVNGDYARALGVRILAQGPGRPVVVPANRDRMIQVMTNLLSNAAKFSRPGGAVDVALSDAGSAAQITVRDYGTGIPKEAQARLFERFAQAGGGGDPRRRGSGLGLSIAKAIVEQHGGAIGFESQEGQGTTFRIELPKRRLELLGAA